MKTELIFLFTLIASISSMYGSGSSVISLTKANFNKEVINSKDLWIIEFYAPWCGHCKQLEPEYEKAARALKGIVKIGAVNADEEKELGGQFGIRGFPTIKYFGENKKQPTEYQSGRTARDIVNFALQQIKEVTNKRLSGGSGSSNSKSKSSGSSGSNSNSNNKKAATDKDVIVLEDGNFDETVFKSKDMWLIEFYAPWCGHCKNLEPHWNQAAHELKGKVKVAKVDATVHTQLANRFNIKGFPTIKIFPPGQKSDKNSENYEGPRDASGIVSAALEKLDKYGIVASVDQLTSQTQYNEICAEKNGVCLIAFLPHIYDSNAKQRNTYIKWLTETSKTSRKHPISYLWAQGGDFYDWEQKLNLSFGYPAVVAINHNKKYFVVSRNSFELEKLKQFVQNLFIGKEPVNPLPAGVTLKTVKEWDGKDAVIETKTENDEF